MARIRSIHPGIFTDEDFMALSMAARVVLPGLWTEADDHGVFAWKPLTLKARLVPVDNVEMAAILAELEDADFIKRFRDGGGREFGLIRNFRKFQRPKKPSYVHPFSEEFSQYVGLTDAGPPPRGNHGGTQGEESEQMEDEGEGEGGEKGKEVKDLVSLGRAIAAACAAAQARGPEIIRLPTNRYKADAEEVPIFENQVREYEQLYPAVDVRAHLRSMRAWLISNTDKRKTRKGMMRFVNSWLEGKQNKATTDGTAGRNRSTSGAKPSNLANHLEGLARLVDEADGRDEGVSRPGQLALAAPEIGRSEVH